MPSKSPEQARLMRAVAHGWKMPGGGGPTREVARKFVNADRRKKVQSYNFGGTVMGPGMLRKPQLGPLSRDPRAMPPVGMNGPPKLMQSQPRAMPQAGMGGPLGQIRNLLKQGMPQGVVPPGRRVAPPPGQFPGGGNPMLAGRNPLMRGAANQNRMMRSRGATSFLR